MITCGSELFVTMAMVPSDVLLNSQTLVHLFLLHLFTVNWRKMFAALLALLLYCRFEWVGSLVVVPSRK